MQASNLFKQYASSDYFFNYGLLDSKDEAKHDLIEVIVQPQKSMFFFREFGAGIKNMENFPSGLRLRIAVTYGIANAVAFRNTVVTDGSEDYPDRRLAVSQDSIEYKQDDAGNLDLSIFYFLYADVKNPSQIMLSTGVIQ